VLNAVDNTNRSSLFHAVRNGHKKTVELLLAAEEVNMNSMDIYNSTPLSAAARHGHDEVVKMLLIQRDIDIGCKDKFGRTALKWAMLKGKSDVYRLLIDHYKEMGKPIHAADFPDMTTSGAQVEGRIFCDVCLFNIPDMEVRYHCTVCNSGDFDICQDCFGSGMHWLSGSHKLSKRTDAFVNVAD
jgi:hypothetical protein